MRRFGHGRNIVVVAVVVAVLAGTVWGGQGRQRADRVLQLTPADSLFCVRINNLDGTLSEAGAFVQGIAPDGFDAGAMVRAKLTKLMGAERMEQVRTRGSFVAFGTVLPSEEGDQGPFANMFVGMLVPVKDYKAFVGGDTPGGRGVATLSVDGEPKAVAASFGRYALVCSDDARDKLVRARKLLRSQETGLRDALGSEERAMAAESPIWLYGNVQKASALVKPLVSGKLEQIKGELKKSGERKEMPFGDPEGIIRFYATLLDIMTSETASVCVALAPSSEACRVTVAAKAVPGSEMAATMSPPAQRAGYTKALGYLHDGAVFNVASVVNTKAWERSYLRWIGLLPKLVGAEVPQAELDGLRELTRKSFQAMGDSVSISFAPASEEGFPFSMQYVIDVKDGATIENAIEEELRLTNSAAFTKFFENLGLSMHAEIERNAGRHKGVTINAAQVTFEMGDDDSPPGQMLKKMWGDGGIAYRWAIVGDRCAYTIGQDAEKHVRTLIDQIQAGGPTGVCSEVKAAMDAIPQSAQADLVGSFNYVRALDAVLGFIPLPDGQEMPELNLATEHSVAFAGRSSEGGCTLWAAVPKKHIMEIKSAFETFGEQMKQHQKQQ